MLYLCLNLALKKEGALNVEDRLGERNASSTVLATLGVDGPMSRAELARRLSLSPATVTMQHDRRALRRQNDDAQPIGQREALDAETAGQRQGDGGLRRGQARRGQGAGRQQAAERGASGDHGLTLAASTWRGHGEGRSLFRGHSHSRRAAVAHHNDVEAVGQPEGFDGLGLLMPARMDIHLMPSP